ncbi:MAG: hypothetical protein ACRD40_12765 [Candidatus Acidiferrales bacterium]
MAVIATVGAQFKQRTAKSGCATLGAFGGLTCYLGGHASTAALKSAALRLNLKVKGRGCAAAKANEDNYKRTKAKAIQKHPFRHGKGKYESARPKGGPYNGKKQKRPIGRRGGR